MMRGMARSVTREVLKRRRLSPYEPDQRRVLLIRPDHLGDLLFLRPALKRFRARLPEWHITLAIGPWSRLVVEDDPNIDEILEIPFPGFDREGSTKPWQPYELLLDQAAFVRASRPRAAVILRDDHWWGALLAQQSAVPTIIGSDDPALKGIVTDSVALRSSHWVARNIEMLEFAARRLGKLDEAPAATPATDPLIWNITEDDRAAATQIVKSAGVDRPYVVVHPGSGAPVKLWSARRWAHVAAALEAAGFDVVLTGSRTEESYARQIASLSDTSVHVIAGHTSLRELAAVFDQSMLVAGVDSGPLHLAVAVDRPTVHIYGPSDPATYGPWGEPRKHVVVRAGISCPLCGNLSVSRPEGAGCMTAVSEHRVVDAILGLLPR